MGEEKRGHTGWVQASLCAVFLLVGQSTFQCVSLPPSADLHVQLSIRLSFRVMQNFPVRHIRENTAKTFSKKIFPHLI